MKVILSLQTDKLQMIFFYVIRELPKCFIFCKKNREKEESQVVACKSLQNRGMIFEQTSLPFPAQPQWSIL